MKHKVIISSSILHRNMTAAKHREHVISVPFKLCRIAWSFLFVTSLLKGESSARWVLISIGWDVIILLTSAVCNHFTHHCGINQRIWIMCWHCCQITDSLNNKLSVRSHYEQAKCFQQKHNFQLQNIKFHSTVSLAYKPFDPESPAWCWLQFGRFAKMHFKERCCSFCASPMHRHSEPCMAVVMQDGIIVATFCCPGFQFYSVNKVFISMSEFATIRK